MFSKKRYSVIIVLAIYVLLLLALVHSEKNVENSSINSFVDAIWYSLVTLSTVGYGDYYPVSFLGKIIGLVFIFGSLGVLGYFISQLTFKLTKYMDDKKHGFFGTKMENHIVLIGYDKFSSHILQQIVTSNHKLSVVTDKKEDVDIISNKFSSKDVFVLYSDFESFENLEKVNIRKSSKVFVNFSDDTQMLVYILNLKNLYSDLDIIVSLNNANFKETFESAGVLYAVSRDDIAAKLVASYIFEPDVAILTEDLMSSASDENDYDIMEFKIDKNSPYISKDYDYVFLDIRKTYSSVLLGIYKNGVLLKNPMKQIFIEDGDYLVIMTDGVSQSKILTDFNTTQGRF